MTDNPVGYTLTCRTGPPRKENDAPNGYRIEQVLSAWHSARTRLLTEDPDLAHDEDALSGLLGVEEGDILNILTRLLRASVAATTLADAAGEMVANIKARQDRFKRRADLLRATAFGIMDVIDEKRITLPDLTASIRNGVQSAVIVDEGTLANEYIRIRREPDKAAILADLKRGVVVAGAQLSNGAPSLMIKVR